MTRYIVLAIFLSTTAWAQTSQPTTWEGRVIRVIDGDTVVVSRPAAKGCWTFQTIRIAGVDSPEKSQPYGKAAAQYTGALMFNFKVVVKVTGKGVHGRWIGDVCRGKSKYRCLSYRLVRDGWAWWYKQYSTRKDLQRAEKKARKEQKGLWQGKNPIPPWEWRKKH
jgi:endonuclease YncB( thermonuclease family)